jgi:iron complex outermembrane recepter protein
MLKMTCPCGRGAFAVALFLTASLGARAQTVPPPAQSNTDDIVNLSEFDVVSRRSGYIPTESSTGSRVAAQIKDLPYAISAVTSEFIKDFGVFALTDELAFSSSMNGLNDVGGFALRGYGGNISLRNGFARLGFFDPIVYDRVEFIKGPAAAVYGQTNPGGIVNFVTKRPKKTPHQSFDQTFGSYQLQRTELETTGPIPTSATGDPKLFYIIETAYDHRYYESPNQAATTRVAYLDLLYQIRPGTSLSFDFDYEYRSYTGGTSGTSLPEIINTALPATNPNQVTGIAYDMVHHYYTDASQWNHRTIFNYELVFDSKLTDIFSIRAAGDIYRSPRFTYGTGVGGFFDPATRTMTSRSNKTTFNLLQGDGVSGAVDLLAHYNISGQGEQKTLFTVDYYKNIGKRPLWTLTNSWVGGAAAPTAAAPVWNVDSPTFTPYIPFTSEKYTLTTNSGGLLEDDYALARGASLRQFGKFFNSKLTVAVGIRADKVYTFKEALAGTPSVLTPIASATGYAPTNWSKEMGLVYQITPEINAYVNRAESFVPNSPSNASPGVALVNQTGLGYEAGVKAAMMNGKLNFTADVFDIKLKGVYVAEFDPTTGVTTNIANGTQLSKGVEFDLNWAVSDKLQIVGSWSFNHAYYGDQGQDLDLTGRQISGVPKYQYNAHANWQVMSGLSLTAAVRWYDKFRIDNGGSFKTANVTLPGNNNGQRNIWAKSYAVVDLGAIYRWKTAATRQRLQVSIKNVLNEQYVIVGGRVPGDRVGAYVTYGIDH